MHLIFAWILHFLYSVAFNIVALLGWCMLGINMHLLVILVLTNFACFDNTVQLDSIINRFTYGYILIETFHTTLLVYLMKNLVGLIIFL